MKIRELTGYNNHPMMQKARTTFQNKPEDLNRLDPNVSSLQYLPYYQIMQFNKYLSDHGFKQLGAGAFAGVWEHPDHPWVFKIFKGDEAYFTYYNYCKQHRNNPNVPRIKGHPIKINNDTYAIRMEKLDPIDQTLFKEMDNIIATYEKYALGVSKKQGAEVIGQINSKIAEYKHTYPGICKIIEMIYASGYRPDLHFNNIMQRGNVPVITDPMVGSGMATKIIHAPDQHNQSKLQNI